MIQPLLRGNTVTLRALTMADAGALAAAAAESRNKYVYTRVPDGHLGLAGMRARADRIGASFSCRSQMGEGTTIEVLVPEPAIVAAGLTATLAESTAIRDD